MILKNERIKKYRDKKKEKGYKQINIFLDKKALLKLNIMKKLHKKTNSEIIEWLIKRDSEISSIYKHQHLHNKGKSLFVTSNENV